MLLTTVLLLVLGGGRSPELAAAASAYQEFLLQFAAGKADADELQALLDAADEKLNVAFERASGQTVSTVKKEE